MKTLTLLVDHATYHQGYGNTGYGVSCLGIQNKIDIWLKVNCSKVSFDVFRNGMMASLQIWANFYKIYFLNMTHMKSTSFKSCTFSEKKLLRIVYQYMLFY